MAGHGFSPTRFIQIVCISFALLLPKALQGLQQQNPVQAPSAQQENSPQQTQDKNQIPDTPPPPAKDQEPSKKPAETTPDHQEENPNPAQAAADKTKQVTVQAAQATKQFAEQGLVRMRNWEQSWLTGVFVEEGQPLVALTSEQRQHIYLEQTLITPGAYLKRMFAAGIDQARGVPSQWDDGWSGYAERFASREGQFIATNTLAAWANAKLGYEVRYDLCRCHGFWPRTHHAIVRNFLTYDRTEVQWRPQLGLYAGAFGGGLISTAWKPHPRNAFAEGGRAMAGQAAYGTLLNLFIEFAGEINRKLGARRRDSSQANQHP
jgi:hypothetical protein